jgi:hypothetical protein
MRKALTLLIFISKIAFAQSIKTPKPVGIFLSDSIVLGEVISFSLAVKHNSAQEVFFADKSHNYSPFELVDKTYFPTQTINGVSTDSAIYQLRTFSIDKNQKLSIPIFFMKNTDSVLVFSNTDSVKMIDEIGKNNIDNKLYEKATLLPMKQKVNLLYLFFKIAVLVLSGTIWWLFFGKIVKSQLRILSLYQGHLEFKNSFNRLTKSSNKANIEKSLLLWKKYIGKLQQSTFQNMTTPEIIKNIPSESLSEALKEIDKSIYGSNISEKVTESFEVLKILADKNYNQRKKEFLVFKKQ